jgi:glycosyltransferase involved in cell wall biosynthesis
MGAAARTLAVENYSWSTIARRLDTVYASVTGGREAARAA